ncbi:hypothetical protein KAJ89_02890 [Candidatus Parcubacteria bacterium]|nr:hypothetical protein [Candidatus Parcubacteria bacterium]
MSQNKMATIEEIQNRKKLEEKMAYTESIKNFLNIAVLAELVTMKDIGKCIYTDPKNKTAKIVSAKELLEIDSRYVGNWYCIRKFAVNS